MDSKSRNSDLRGRVPVPNTPAIRRSSACRIVLDVPKIVVVIVSGFFLYGTGVGYADDFDLEIVDSAVSVTGKRGIPIEPVKPGFETV